MFVRMVCLLAAAALIGSTSGLMGQSLNAEPKPPATAVTWLTDYVKAKQVARAADKPLMVVFRCVP